MQRQEQKDWWWVLGGLVLIVLLIVSLVLNFNFNNDSKYLENAEGIKIDNGDEKIVWEEYPSFTVELKENYVITAPGTYYLSGKIDDGGISIRVPENTAVRLVFDNVTIKNSVGPAISCEEADDLVIVLNGDNYFEDGKEYEASYDDDVKGVIYSKSDLTFSGDGKLSIKANYQDGIVSKDDLKFTGGEYYISAADDGIRGKDSVYITGGTFAIDAKGDGIKSTKENDNTKGFVLIQGGKITISVGDDGIHAYNRLIIDAGDINITKSYEGLEAQKIYVNGGDIKIFSNDDGINAGGGDTTTTNNARPGAFDVDESCVVAINGGTVYVNAAGDGIDSNGYVNFNGGEVVVDGPTNNGNGALDAGAKITMNGGKVIAVGASGMAEGLGTDSLIHNISVFFASTYTKGTKIEIKNSDGDVVLTHTAAKSFNHFAAGTSDFKLGETYILYVDDKEVEEFTITDTTMVLGKNYDMGGPGGAGAPGNMGPGGGPRR